MRIICVSGNDILYNACRVIRSRRAGIKVELEKLDQEEAELDRAEATVLRLVAPTQS